MDVRLWSLFSAGCVDSSNVPHHHDELHYSFLGPLSDPKEHGEDHSTHLQIVDGAQRAYRHQQKPASFCRCRLIYLEKDCGHLPIGVRSALDSRFQLPLARSPSGKEPGRD